MPTNNRIDFIEELQWRGLLAQCTDAEQGAPGLRRHLEGGTRSAYAGFDPTAPSLTIGNLVPIMVLRHFQRAGHHPVVVMGGGTGLIGDPSGKSAERTLMTEDTVRTHVDLQRPIFDAILGDGPHTVTNNLDWLGGLSYLEALRDVGKHFSVNMMMQKDSVKARLESREQGISYTEFSYMILQSYDFLKLYQDRGVTIQLGGSDQFGNIVAGLDLIRRASAAGDRDDPSDGVDAFGLTAPLVTKADGGKFGKTEAGAVWLSPPAEPGATVGTTPYAYYQFWLNASDADVPRFLRFFTLLTKGEIEDLERSLAEAPGKREAHRALAREATALLHGPEAVEQAEKAAQALFSGDIKELPAHLIDDVFAGVPSSEMPRDRLSGDGIDAVDLLVETGLAKSKREAREFVANGSVSVNGDTLAAGDAVTADRLLHGSVIAVRRGKKAWHLTRWA